MQGYFQIASFNVPPVNGEPNELALVDYVVISRRSRDRAGLRYQRRGVGEEGNVANFVQTETVMRVLVGQSLSLGSAYPTEPFPQRDGLTNVFSYVQLRGSSTSKRCDAPSILTCPPFSSTLLEPIRVRAKAPPTTRDRTDSCTAR